MKFTTCLTALVLSGVAISGYGQNQTKPNNRILLNATEIPVTFHGETVPLRDYREDPNAANNVVKTLKTGYHPKGDWPVNTYDYTNAKPNGLDPVFQTQYAAASATKAPTVNVEGMPAVTSPADPSLDVGPNHVIQMINHSSGSTFQIWDKSGNTVQGSTIFDNFMASASTNGNPGWNGGGDPIVIYDERADRWLLSEFESPGSGNALYVAISTTPDPTGSYYTYTISMPSFPDYPKYSVWEDEYVITANIGSSDVVALNRTDMLAGVTSSAQMFTQSNFGTIGFQASTPVSLNGTTLPPSGTPAMVMRVRDDAWNGSSSDALEIWELDIDWSNSSNSSLSQTTTLPVSAFDSGLCGYTSFQCIPQPGSSTTLDPLREILMNRIHYRNFGTHESIVTCHSVDIDGTDWAGIRWYELRRTGGTSGSWTLYQEGTYNPDNDHRWMPSIGLSATGQIGLAYNVSSSSTYPSLRYTGRKDCDPLGVMTEPETVIVDGTSNNSSNRYGDYNALGCDPTDGETFWFTGMYNTSTSGQTRVAAFAIPGCSPVVQFAAPSYNVDESSASNANNCLPYAIVNVPIQIGSDPSAAADVTVTVTGGTATNTVDYDINNTSFSFDGTTLSGTVEIWVYNDDYVEGNETIDLGYTLNANGGDATNGAINQTVTVTINDDDLAPANMTNTVTVLSEDFESGFGGFTTNNPSGDDAWQIGDAAAATSGAFTVPTSNATDFAWINDDACNCDQNDVDLTFPSVDLTGFSGATLTFDAYYEDNTYQGDQEVAEVQVSVNGGANTTITTLAATGGWAQQTVDLTPYVGNNNVVLTINYSDGTGWLYGCTIDNVLIEGDGPIAIQTAVNTSAADEAYLGPNETVHFYDPTTGNVMMTLDNTSAHDYGCVTVEVDRDGSTPTAMEFASSSAADYIHSKSFKVVPANNNPSGTFDVTLYYEDAEVTAWETATGNNRNNLEVIKVAGNNAINDVTPANYASFTIDNVSATMGSFGSDLTFTASFTNGFSGFGLGVYATPTPTTPVGNFNSNNTTVCEGDAVSFTDLSSGVPTQWAWDFGDGNTSTQQNPSNTYTTAGTYTVTLTVTNSFGNDTYTQNNYITVGAPTTATLNESICQGESFSVGSSTYSTAGTYTDVLTNVAGCDSTVTLNLTVNQLPTTTVGPAITEDICDNADPITLSGTPSGGSHSGNGVSGSSFNAGNAGIGTHTITYTYTDGNGCTGTSTMDLVVIDCSVGIGEEGLSGVQLYPNPNEGTFVLTGLEVGTSYQIYDAAGKLVMSRRVTSTQEEVVLPIVESGNYFLTSTKDGKQGTIQFLVKSK